MYLCIIVYDFRDPSVSQKNYLLFCRMHVHSAIWSNNLSRVFLCRWSESEWRKWAVASSTSRALGASWDSWPSPEPLVSGGRSLLSLPLIV